jgi:hypothetical protein
MSRVSRRRPGAIGRYTDTEHGHLDGDDDGDGDDDDDFNGCDDGDGVELRSEDEDGDADDDAFINDDDDDDDDDDDGDDDGDGGGATTAELVAGRRRRSPPRYTDIEHAAQLQETYSDDEEYIAAAGTAGSDEDVNSDVEGMEDDRGNTPTHSRMTPMGSPEGWKWVFWRRIPVSQQNPSQPTAWTKPAACDWATFGKFGGSRQFSVEFALT